MTDLEAARDLIERERDRLKKIPTIGPEWLDVTGARVSGVTLALSILNEHLVRIEKEQ